MKNRQFESFSLDETSLWPSGIGSRLGRNRLWVRFLAVSDIYPMFIEPTITWVPSDLWVHKNCVKTKRQEMEISQADTEWNFIFFWSFMLLFLVSLQPSGISYTCSCTAGWTGVNCNQQLDGCVSNPCRNGGTCVGSQSGGYTCTCTSSYTGQNCQTPQQGTILFKCGLILSVPVPDVVLSIIMVIRSSWFCLKQNT